MGASRDPDRSRLVLTRKPGEGVWIGPDVHITVSELKENGVRILIQAPRSVTLLRDELGPPGERSEAA